jgi:hypothetical protein
VRGRTTGTGPLLQGTDGLFPQTVGVDAQPPEDADGHRVPLAREGDEQMFRIHFWVSPTAGLLHGPLDDPFGVFGELGGLDRGASLLGVQAEDDLTDAVFLQAHLAQDFRRPALFLHQPQQQVLRAHIEVAHAPGRLFGQAEHPFRFRSEEFPVVFHR